MSKNYLKLNVKILIFFFLLFTVFSCNNNYKHKQELKKIESFLIQYYEVLEQKQIDQFDNLYSNQLKTWFSKENISLDSVKIESVKYYSKYPLQKHKINLETIEYKEVNENDLEISYNIDYQCKQSKEDDWLKFNIDITIILNKERKITSISDNIITRTKKEYFLEDFIRTKNQNLAKYYRIITYDGNKNPVGITKDYYITGELQWEGVFTKINLEDDSKNIMEGKVIWYYKNGNKESKKTYKDGIIYGDAYEWNSDGLLSRETLWIDGKPNVTETYTYYTNSKLKHKSTLSFDPLTSTKILCDEKGVCENVIYESFKNNFVINKWEKIDSWELSNDALICVKSDSVESSAIVFKNIQYNENDFSMSMYVKEIFNPNKLPVGMLFGYYDKDNYSQFLIFGNTYVVYEKTQGIRNLIQMESSESLRENSWNRLILKKVGDKLIFIINDDIQGSFEYSSFKGSNFGFVAEGTDSLIVMFDEFEFREKLQGNQVVDHFKQHSNQLKQLLQED